ncbi:hypothetical protein [uncultured Legionella sp.]|uniref:hypothetical protein n=1 Tax=uncultured Legionella sp. TaxID=210934 RepID=UPI002631DE61|nr:hypothetical protein [uncultured Legionella sp.]
MFQYARFQINPSFRQNKVPNSCGEIALITGSATNPLSYEMEHQKQITFYLSCRNFTELKEIADGINNYLKQAEIKELKLPSLPRTWEQCLWTLGLIAAFLFNSKRIETCFDKSEELVTVKTIWVLHWTQTYPLKDVKKIVLHQAKDKRQHLIMNLTISRIDLGDVTDLDTAEQQHLCRAINNFLGLN